MRPMANVVALTSLAAATLTAAPLVASAQQTAYAVSPVSVNTCTLNAGDILTPYPSTVRNSAGLNVSFTNTSSAPIAGVEIVANYNGQTETIDDRGTFAPNAVVNHDLAMFRDAVYSGGAAACSVAKVDFADGSSWAAPASSIPSAPLATEDHR